MIIGIIGIIYIGIGVIVSAIAEFMFIQEMKEKTDEEFVKDVYKNDEATCARLLDNFNPSTIRTIIELGSPLCNTICWPYLIYNFVKAMKNF